MIGWAFRQLAIWGGLGLLFYAIAGDRLKLHQDATASATEASAATAAAAPPAGASPNSLVFHANKQGHVILEGVVNGTPIRFIVDTGATFVALTARDAEAAGITHGDMSSSVALSTANGVVHAGKTQLREVRIGQLAIDDVPAVVQDRLGVSLLGQSFLTRLDSYEMRDGVLTLNYW
jgi:aspartyl protease family protein